MPENDRSMHSNHAKLLDLEQNPPLPTFTQHL